jgi:hypothetical protein
VLEPGASSVVTLTPSGTQPRWLGALGHVNALTYSWANPGGPDQLSCLLQMPANFRTDALNPGRIVRVYRGGACIWDGKLVEPTPGADGWQITAIGLGNAGTDFDAVYTTWGNQNDAVNQAIARGLRWSNAGISASVWLGQVVDSGSQTITDLLNLFCTLGGFTWYVSVLPAGGGSLSVYAFPAATVANANRVLVASGPVPRTLGGDVNEIFLRYQSSADGASVATYGTTSVTTAGAQALHGNLEAYEDLSSAGTLTAGAAQALGASVLARYQRASFAGPFTIRQGELLNPGGVPADLGQDHCGTICKVILADYGYGGEIVPDPAVFMVGAYAYDDMAGQAQVTPFQSLNLSVGNMLAAKLAPLAFQEQWRQAHPPLPKPKPKPAVGPRPFIRAKPKPRPRPRRFPGTPR